MVLFQGRSGTQLTEEAPQKSRAHTVFFTKLSFLSLSLAAELIKSEDHVCMAMIGATVRLQSSQLLMEGGGVHQVNISQSGIHQQIVGAWRKHPALKLRSDGCRVMRGLLGNKRAGLEAKEEVEGSSKQGKATAQVIADRKLLVQLVSHTSTP